MLKSLWNPRVRIALVLAGMFAASACGGSSCGGCSCMTPIPGGYPLDKRISGAVQARVSQSGVEFLQNSSSDLVGCFMAGGLDFCIPESQSDINIIGIGLGTATVCQSSTGNRDANDMCIPGGQCDIHIEVKSIKITPQANQDTLAVVVRLLVYDTAKNGHPASDLPVKVETFLSSTTCHISLDTERTGQPTVGFTANIKFSFDAATGYTKIAIADVNIIDLDDGDIDINGTLLCTIASWFKGMFIDSMIGSLLDTVTSMTDQLCQQCANQSECPNGTTCTGGVCKFADGACLQSLGIEGRIDVGSQLASFAPGMQAYLDILARAGGSAWAGKVSNANGINLGLYGGARSPTHNECVPVKTPPALDPVAPANTFTGASPGPVPFHAGIGVHDSFLNHAAFGAWEGGVLCLDIGSETSEMLNAGTFSILVRSLGDLTHGDNVPIKMSIRPQNPPVITLGEGTFNADGSILDPLMKLSMQDFAIELMALIDERYVRVLTIHTDVVLPMSLRMNATSQIEIVMGDVKSAFTNVRVTDTGMLSDNPEDIAAALPDVLGVALPFLASAFPAIDVPAVTCTGDTTKAIKLTIPSGGITSVENKRFLGIFTNLAFGPAASHFRATATAEVTAVDVPPTAAFALGRGFDARRAPAATVRFGGFGLDGAARGLEWTYRVDGGFWSPYLTRPEVRIEGGPLWLQGRHQVEVRARLRDVPESESEPVVAEILIDTVAPTLTLERRGRVVKLLARDLVTPPARLQYSWRVPGGEFSTWSSVAEAPAGERGLEVRARDEAGNVTVAAIDAAPSAAADTQVGCAAGGTGSALLGLLCAGGMLRWRRRRRAATVLSALLLVVTVAATPGCNCGSSPPAQDDAGEEPDPVYSQGAIGRYASLAAAPDGTLYVTAYEEKYGDLVIGTIGASPDYQIKWEIIDGVPTDSRVKGDPNGWRFGIKETGANVGFYTSLIVAPDGKLRVAYREATAAYRDDPAAYQLKYAVKSSDSCDRSIDCWQPHVVDANGLAGYYANLTWSAEGVPTIAYLAPGQVDAATGRVTAELRFAVASSAEPAQASDWAITVVDKIRVSCAGMCSATQACVASTSTCATVDATGCGATCTAAQACVAGACVAKAITPCPGTCDSPKVCVTEENVCVTGDPAACTTACSDTQVCLAGACVDAVPAPQVVDIPVGLGHWVKTVRDSVGRPVLVYYDRVNGDLKRAMVIGPGTWSIKAIDADGDVGQFPSALLDAADSLHVAYTDAAKGRLLYLKTTLSDGATPTKEVVDDGRQNADGPHKVGAETQLAIDSTAQIHILYQDQRVSALLHATKASGATAWTTAPLRQDAKAGFGFFTRLVQTSSGFYFVDYRYDRLDTPTGEITQAEEAVKARAHGAASKGNTFGWLEVGSL
ncbi:MAG: hypothetical protein HY906_05895 [Deltaproteobacteria bacterium]|nr:hypothetical protein [Deltaproteobacteria bacterium]